MANGGPATPSVGGGTGTAGGSGNPADSALQTLLLSTHARLVQQIAGSLETAIEAARLSSQTTTGRKKSVFQFPTLTLKAVADKISAHAYSSADAYMSDVRSCYSSLLDEAHLDKPFYQALAVCV